MGAKGGPRVPPVGREVVGVGLVQDTTSGDGEWDVNDSRSRLSYYHGVKKGPCGDPLLFYFLTFRSVSVSVFGL